MLRVPADDDDRADHERADPLTGMPGRPASGPRLTMRKSVRHAFEFHDIHSVPTVTAFAGFLVRVSGR